MRMDFTTNPYRAAAGALVSRPPSIRPVRGLSDRALAWILLSPALLLFAGLGLGPLLANLYLSLAPAGPGTPGGAGFDTASYVSVFADPGLRRAGLISAMYLGVATAAEVAIGFALAWLCHSSLRRGGTWVVALPAMLSPAAAGLIWSYLHAPEFGVLSGLAGLLALVDPAGPAGSGFWQLVLADVWIWSPLFAVLTLAGLRSVSPDVEDMADLDRAGPWRRLWTISVPLALPFIGLAAAIRLASGVGSFALAHVLGAGADGTAVSLVAIELERLAFDAGRKDTAAALAFVLAVAALAATGGAAWALRRIRAA